MKHRGTFAILLSLLTCFAGAEAEENLRVLPETLNGAPPADMMNIYLRAKAAERFEQWKLDYEQRKSPEQIAEYQRTLRDRFLDAIGPLPERTPLNPQTVGVVKRDGYNVEKVIFESQPKHYVTALLFLPDSSRHKPPHPGVLVPCGHAREAKAYESYQTMGALLALNGMAALVFDPIDQGERSQWPEHLPALWGTRAHTMIGIGSILLGRNTAWFEIWDGMRAIDYLQSRGEVDPKRIGCTGNSGGGTQTSYLMALDDRIKAASPSCYITNFYERILDLGPQDAEQNIYGQLGFGMDHADYLMMRAPSPVMICAATKDFFNIEGTWQSFRYAKRLYTRMGFAERIDLMENDAGHNYNQLQRQSVIRWMSRWLLGRDEPITEPTIELLNDQEVRCAPNGLVMEIEGARSTYDLNREYEKELSAKRRGLWASTQRAEMLERVRRIAGVRNLREIPAPKVQELDTVEREGCVIRKLLIEPEAGIYLPALMFVPAREPPSGAVLYVHENGKAEDSGTGGAIEKLAGEGKLVLAVDVRGTGETQQDDRQNYFKPDFGQDGIDVYTAYLLGRSYVGMRAEDLLVSARFLTEQGVGAKLDMIAVGNVGVPALHAAALEPDMFASVRLVRTLVSWSDVVRKGLSYNQFANTVHAALRVYDLGDLAGTPGAAVTIEESLNAMGEPAQAN